MALTTVERAALPDSDFAVPGKRKLPIPDENHVRMAWQEVGRTQGLSDDERSTARHRIMERAKALGMDTSGWSTLKAALEFQAMSLQVPDTPGHPNKMPFSGVLTRLDEPSDAPPHGSGGRCVILTTEAAREALAGLLLMAVNLTTDLKGHDAKAKVGVITGADIVGNAIQITGDLWAADFPDAAARIRAMKDVLGFSFEMKNVQVADPGADILVIERCDFTGAAILKKADAAYHSTSLAASKDDGGELDMTKEELEAIFGPMLATALGPVNTELAALKASQEKITVDINASKEAEGKVRPHSDALRACAGGMQAAGIGGHPTSGHVVRLNKMADHMDASAALGNIPHIYRDHDFLIDAAGDKSTATAEETAKAIKDGIEAAVAPLKTVIEDLKAKAFKAAEEPERRTISPAVQTLLRNNGIDITASGETAEKVPIAKFDAFLDAAGKRGTEAITLKLQAREAGLLAAA